MSQWFVRIDGKVGGPYPEDKLKQWLKAKKIEATAVVREDGSEDWQPIIPALYPAPAAPIPSYTTETSQFAPRSTNPSPPRITVGNAAEAVWRVIFNGTIICGGIAIWLAFPHQAIAIAGATLAGLFFAELLRLVRQIERNTRRD